MTILLVALHIIVCLFLIMVVLLQTGKGADLAGAFGGGGSQTAFGARGATTLLHKLTTGSAVLFMITSLSLAIVASRPSGSVVQDPSAASTAAPSTATEDAVATGDPAENGQSAGAPEGAAVLEGAAVPEGADNTQAAEEPSDPGSETP